MQTTRSGDLLVTHRAHRAPNEVRWQTLPFMVRPADDEQQFFFANCGDRRKFQRFNKDITEEVLTDGTFTPIDGGAQPYISGKRLWISPDGYLWLASSRNPIGDRYRMPLMSADFYKAGLAVGHCPPFENHPTVAQWQYYIRLILQEKDETKTARHSYHGIWGFILKSPKGSLSRSCLAEAFAVESAGWNIKSMVGMEQVQAQGLVYMAEQIGLTT